MQGQNFKKVQVAFVFVVVFFFMVQLNLYTMVILGTEENGREV